jgi:hypothetical protein
VRLFPASCRTPKPFSYVVARGAYLAEVNRLIMMARGPIALDVKVYQSSMITAVPEATNIYRSGL